MADESSAMKVAQSKNSDFKHGSIIRIELENFMTYKHIEFRPGPFLNLILGPNGSGKSALVSAIILGFGGEPHVTGRSSNLIDYVKNGTQMASITIEIYSDVNQIIQREIKVTHHGNKNECHNYWKLNGESVNKAKIVEFTKKLNIDITNLCQILPQEKVIEFSRMNPKDLLFSTEKSIGDVNMFSRHMRLIELSEQINELEKRIKESKALVTKCQNFKTNIEPDLRLINQKKQFEEEIKWLQNKQVWLEFEEKRLEHVNIKKELTEKNNEYNEFLQKIKPLKTNIIKTATMLQEIQDEKSKFKTLMRKYYLKLNEIHKNVDSLNEKINQLVLNFNDTISEQSRSKQRLEECKRNIENYKDDLNNHPNKDSLKTEAQKLKTELVTIDKDLKEVMLEIQNLKTQTDSFIKEQNYFIDRKKSIRNLFNVRMDKVNQTDSNTRQAYEWLTKNKDLFKGEIYPPLITLINVSRNEYSKYVEAAIGSMDMSTFLCENIEDLELFTEKIQTELNILVNVAIIPKDGDNLENEATFDIKRYEKYGIFSRISDLFTAPKPVMAYLIKTYHIDKIPVGNDETEKYIDELINTSRFKKIITAKNVYTIVVSVYDNEKTTRITSLNPANYLNIIIDEKEIERIDNDLQHLDQLLKEGNAKINELGQKSRILKEKKEEKFENFRTIESKINEILKIETKIQEKENQIKSIEESMKSVANQKEELATKLSEIHLKQLKLIEKIPDILNECVSKNKSASTIELKIKFVNFIKAFYENEHSKTHSEELEKKQELEILKTRSALCKEEARKYRQRAIDKSGFDMNNDSDNKIRDKFDELPATLNEVFDTISVLKMRCEGIGNVDNSLLEEYKRYQKEIEEKTIQCDQLERELQAIKDEIDHLKPIWIDTLEQLIDKINKNFSKFMEYLKYSGEVYLFKGRREYSFDDYGIRIRVRFRDSEPLQDLDAYHQSGGERSVSTVIYMLSLQELAHVPFRIVDEINQGMDEKNERCVFDLITEVSRQNSSQYFLLSPKLLNNLNYTAEMRIHIIFNGPHVYVDWNKALNSILNK